MSPDKDVTAAVERMGPPSDLDEQARAAVMRAVSASTAALGVKDSPHPLRTYVLNSLAHAQRSARDG